MNPRACKTHPLQADETEAQSDAYSRRKVMTLAARDDGALVDLNIVREDTLSIEDAGLFLRPSSFFC